MSQNPEDPSLLKELLSLGLDFTPGVGSGKSLAELVEGKDLITNEPICRWLSAGGIILGFIYGFGYSWIMIFIGVLILISYIMLGTIQKRFGDEHYKNAIADYHYILSNLKAENKEYVKTCSRQIAAGKGSIEARCSHLGVPLSKVIVGEDGICKLKSTVERERLNPLDETGASISTNKLFWS